MGGNIKNWEKDDIYSKIPQKEAVSPDEGEHTLLVGWVSKEGDTK